MYKTFPPYIDAYNINYDEISSKGTKKDEQFEEFKSALKNTAYMWGEKAVGMHVLKNGEPLKINDKFVLAIGWFGVGKDNKFKLKKYVLISNGDIYKDNNLEIMQYNYPIEWDVT